MIEVADGEEDAFVAIARQFSMIMAKKEYGRTDIVRDESSPRTFYAVRHWASASAAETCHADPDIHALTGRLYQIHRVTHVVNGVRRIDSMRLLLDDRRTGIEADRRIGFDRRLKDAGRTEGERRMVDRRLGPRRLRGRAA